MAATKVVSLFYFTSWRMEGYSVNADIVRTQRWNQWRESVFSELDKTFGTSGSKGAMRFYGDFQVNCDATDAPGIAKLWATTNPNRPLPILGYETTLLWENTPPSSAAAIMVRLCERIKTDERFFFFKRVDAT